MEGVYNPLNVFHPPPPHKKTYSKFKEASFKIKWRAKHANLIYSTSLQFKKDDTLLVLHSLQLFKGDVELTLVKESLEMLTPYGVYPAY